MPLIKSNMQSVITQNLIIEKLANMEIVQEINMYKRAYNRVQFLYKHDSDRVYLEKIKASMPIRKKLAIRERLSNNKEADLRKIGLGRFKEGTPCDSSTDSKLLYRK